MELIGMLDSPYVRRVAVTFQLLGLPYVHRPISVFRTFEQFRAINPVVKAPTLVCDDGQTLMDSTLIIDHVETVAGRSLMPAGGAERQRALRIIGLGLAACEKAVQIVYEHNLRPAEKLHEPWMLRVKAQLSAALAGLEAELAARALPVDQASINQAGITAAVAWRFVQEMVPGDIDPQACAATVRHSQQAERLEAFLAAPFD
ncbi:glutathione S-transferase family protein [Hydrogenophaga laconesensis]|uniref:Glutathione S-transferase n=1 Tax=Hydrogenophaga laconesensis TaxID=1805971 RepID=A0ABU1VE66_9BURK|nr:glutathione S-transferase [Hydrogenophaga laconesensis]MDR7095766.1 glutathione S-transferase [Hydrogenophaga laconesensis]